MCYLGIMRSWHKTAASYAQGKDIEIAERWLRRSPSCLYHATAKRGTASRRRASMCRAPDFTTQQAKPTEAVAKAAPAPSHDDTTSARKTVEALPPSHSDATRRTTLWDSTMGLTATLILWPLILSVPLVLQHTYRDVFDEAWYDYSQGPKPLGLCLDSF